MKMLLFCIALVCCEMNPFPQELIPGSATSINRNIDPKKNVQRAPHFSNESALTLYESGDFFNVYLSVQHYNIEPWNPR